MVALNQLLFVGKFVGITMAKEIERLSALAVTRAKKKGLYPDGDKLYLQVSDNGAKSWVLRYMINGKQRTMGLGGLNSLSLAEARVEAGKWRKLITAGIDPIEARKSDDAKARFIAARSKTFKQCAEDYIESHKDGWRNAKHLYQWNQSLSTFVYPTIGDLSVQDIDVALVTDVLKPIWKTKTETASRTRGRIERILDWATTKELRQGENPARWRGKLENLLPKPSKVQKVEHHPALPYADISDFMAILSGQSGISARAMELVILTATRTGEVIGAKWQEFDLENKIWTIPADRIKGGREHRIPLSNMALAVLKPLHENKISDFVFPGMRKDKPLSNTAMLELRKKQLKRKDITVHGFRSSFRDWCAEQTNYPREVAEAALSHAVGDKVEAAYRRSDLFDKRRNLMDEWAKYCYQPKAKSKEKVVNIRSKKKAS